MTRPVRARLAVRLYLLGLLQLILLGAAVAGTGFVIHQTSHDFPREEPLTAPPFDRDLGPDRGHHGPPPGLPVGPLLTFFLSGLVIVGVGSFLTARWIVRPLERLSVAARTIGGGDLRVRSGLVRSDELGDVAMAFDEMAERLQQLRLAEKELLANVSHELRTPLARIRVALDIAGEANPTAGASSLAGIGTDLAELEALLDDILTTTRLEMTEGNALHFEMHVEEMGPDVIADRAVGRFRTRHPTRVLDLSVAPNLPLINVDPVLFRRAIDNLLENADRYSPDPNAPIAMRVSLAGSQACFEIVDQGIGISEEDLPHVFTAFFRSERSRSRGSGGVGLGLTLAKRIVLAHGGEIRLASIVSAGTTATILVNPADSLLPR